MYNVLYSKEARRTLERMPQKMATTIQTKITLLATDPYAPNFNAKKLQGRDGYRLRVGEWRVIYEIVDAQLLIQVVRIAARGNAYEP